MTPEQKQRLDEIRKRRDEAAKRSWMDHPPQPTWRDIDFLLSLVKSQEARSADICVCGHSKGVHQVFTDHDECRGCWGIDEPCSEFRLLIDQVLEGKTVNHETEVKREDENAIHELFIEFHYTDDLGVIKTKLAEYVATTRREVEAKYALCRQVQKRGEHSSSMCQCVVAVEQSIRREEREAAFKVQCADCAEGSTPTFDQKARWYYHGLEHKEVGCSASKLRIAALEASASGKGEDNGSTS